MKPNLLVVAPIDNINGLLDKLSAHFNIYLGFDSISPEFYPRIDAIYTNPNCSSISWDRDLLKSFPNLRTFTTASTGTVHVDKNYLASSNIAFTSLTEERNCINKISSTAEHSLCLALAALRKLPASFDHVRAGGWSYSDFIGRQYSDLTVGIIGFGRLGTFFSQYSLALGAKVIVYDPYKNIPSHYIDQVQCLEQIFVQSDLVSLHVHVTDETRGFINTDILSLAKPDLTLVNTSRGEIIDEPSLTSFLNSNPHAVYAADVITDEHLGPKHSYLYNNVTNKDQLILTPHLAGMTYEARQRAFHHAADQLISTFSTS